jgi:DNA polymerase-2
MILGWTRDAFEAQGHAVLYGDTDSVFVQLRGAESAEAREAEARELHARVAALLEERIQTDYGVSSRLVLELEKIYDRFFLPRVRGGRGGSKKRYAGLRRGELELVGLESVRRDWPPIAARLQRGLLGRLFSDTDPLPFAREVVQQLAAGELDDQLIYVRRVRKSSLDSYTKSRPPHVQAARKLIDRGGQLSGSVIRYVITGSGPEPVRLGEALPTGIDRRHYLDKVLRPVADAILSEVGLHFSDAAGEPRQLSLL